jgi:hypothetical protein
MGGERDRQFPELAPAQCFPLCLPVGLPSRNPGGPIARRPLRAVLQGADCAHGVYGRKGNDFTQREEL